MRKTIPQMNLKIQSSLAILTTMFLLFHEVQGIRHRTMISSVPLEHKTPSVSLPWRTSTGGLTSGDPAAIEEKMIVVRRRSISTLSSGVAASEKKLQQHQHQQHHHHWMPSIHEDYFGPRHHKPTHH